ncbi:MAG: class I SAM-dependent methyltransferase [Gaiellaceae bacterium]
MKGSLADRYRDYHAGRFYPEEFVYVPERLPVFVEAVGGPGNTVLDLGCRNGALAKHFLAGNEVVGVDVDSNALAQAAERGVTPVWADVEEPLPFDDGSFDAVVAGEILEHVRFPDQVIAEIGRVLKPDGVFVGSVPNAYRLKNRLVFLVGRPPEKNPMHLRMYSPDAIRRELLPLGEATLTFVGGRFVRLGPRLFANDLVFVVRCQSRDSSASAVSRSPSSSATAGS